MTRKRRYVISAAIFATCVCLALGVLALMPPHPRDFQVNFERIEDGVTRDEVEAILGKPDDLLLGPTGLVTWGSWRHPDGSAITVDFGDAKVRRKHFHDPSGTFTNKFRRWLHFPK